MNYQLYPMTSEIWTKNKTTSGKYENKLRK